MDKKLFFKIAAMKALSVWLMMGLTRQEVIALGKAIAATMEAIGDQQEATPEIKQAIFAAFDKEIEAVALPTPRATA